jgi:hypothetical protein
MYYFGYCCVAMKFGHSPGDILHVRREKHKKVKLISYSCPCDYSMPRLKDVWGLQIQLHTLLT